MFTVSVKGSGSPWVELSLTQLIELFPTATLSATFSELRESIKPEIPPGADPKDYCGALLISVFDTATQK